MVAGHWQYFDRSTNTNKCSEGHTFLSENVTIATKIWCVHTWSCMWSDLLDGCHIRWMICYWVYRMMVANPAPSSISNVVSAYNNIPSDDALVCCGKQLWSTLSHLIVSPPYGVIRVEGHGHFSRCTHVLAITSYSVKSLRSTTGAVHASFLLQETVWRHSLYGSLYAITLCTRHPLFTSWGSDP